MKWHLCWSESEYPPQETVSSNCPLCTFSLLTAFISSHLKWLIRYLLLCLPGTTCLNHLSSSLPDLKCVKLIFLEEVEMAMAAYLWCLLAEHFHLSVRCLIAWQFSFRQASLFLSPPPCFLVKTDSSAASSLLNSKLLFTPQRLAFLLLSVAMAVVKIQRHLCLPWSLWVWFFWGGLLDFYYFLGLVCFGFWFWGFLLLFWVGLSFGLFFFLGFSFACPFSKLV